MKHINKLNKGNFRVRFGREEGISNFLCIVV